MPIHDWTRVSAGTFHAFHTVWIGEIMKALNDDLLPKGFYALAEQHAGGIVADILTLHEPGQAGRTDRNGGGVAMIEARPRVRRRRVATAQMTYRLARRSLAIRHASGHQLVALIEIASPANKDRAGSVEEFVKKVRDALHAGVHVLVVDLLPAGPHDPQGLTGAIWEHYREEDDIIEPDQPLTFASYMAEPLPEAYEETLALGDPLPVMPLFLDRRHYINLPLEPTYQAAYRGMPAYWRDVIEGRDPEQA